MNQSIPATGISPLHQRLIDDMNVRRFSRETQRNYIRDADASLPSCGAHPMLLWRVMCAASRSSIVTPVCRRRP
jgi:hypothetical protein